MISYICQRNWFADSSMMKAIWTRAYGHKIIKIIIIIIICLSVLRGVDAYI